VHLQESVGFNQWRCDRCSHQWDFAGPEERALVPNHLTGSMAEQFLEEFLAIKALIKAEAEKIWNGCSNVHQMISVAANDEKRRVFSEQYERRRDQLIGLQETLIVDRLLPLVAKYQIVANEQKWLLRACDEVWSPVTAGYLDWLTFAVRGHVHGVGTGAIPEWAWQLGGGPRDVARMEQSPEKKASGHFRCLADTLQRDLVEYRKGAIAKAFLAGKTARSSAVTPTVRGKRATRPKPPCFESAVEQLRRNSELTPIEFCRLMDRKADQYPRCQTYLPPKSWKVRSFHEQYEKRRNTVSRFLSSVRKAIRSEEG